MSPVFTVSVIDVLMSSSSDISHGGVGFFPQTFLNSWSSMCVGRDLTDTPMHSYMGKVIVHTTPPSPISHALIVVVE